MSVSAERATPSPLRLRLERLWRPLAPSYELLLGDPMRTGRLRLDGLDPLIRRAAIAGLVTMGGLLVSLVAGDRWRAGALLGISAVNGRLTFAPAALLPITLLGLTAAWCLIFWGAMRATRALRLFVTVVFLVSLSPMGTALAVNGTGSWILAHGPTVIRWSYLAIPVLVVGSSLLPPRTPQRSRIVVLATILTLGCVIAFFTLHGLTHLAHVRQGQAATLPIRLNNSIFDLSILVLPLIVVSALAVIDFSYDVAASATARSWSLPASLARWLLAAFIALKLWIQLFRHLSDWGESLSTRPVTAISTVVVMGALGVLAYFLRRSPSRGEGIDEAKERLIYGSALLTMVPTLISTLAIGIAVFIANQTGWQSGPNSFIQRFPSAFFEEWGPVGAALSSLVVGAAVLVNERWKHTYREFGIGMLLIGGWAFPTSLAAKYGYFPGFSPELFDLAATLAAAVFLAATFRKLPTGRAVRLGAGLAFLWLFGTDGDFLAILGGLIGLPGIVVVVFGIVFSLIADSSFASVDSKRFPRPARTLAWIGYLTLSLTMLCWSTISHGQSFEDSTARVSLLSVGVPLAAWLLIRKPFTPPARPAERR